MPVFTIREVDGGEYADELHALHALTFGKHTPQPDYENGWWWLAYNEFGQSVAFAGMTQSSLGPGYCYFKRAGVLKEHRGCGLQRRLIRCRAERAKRNGFTSAITDTTDNVASANSLIRAGFRLFSPRPWAWKHSLYWIKEL